MQKCEMIETCPFFNDKMASMPSTSEVFKMMYCNDNYAGCARFIVRMEIGKDKVPGDLFPNQVDRVPALIGKE